LDEGLVHLSEADTWFCDGNFKLCPEFFLQLYVIRVKKYDKFITPIFYLKSICAPDNTDIIDYFDSTYVTGTYRKVGVSKFIDGISHCTPLKHGTYTRLHYTPDTVQIIFVKAGTIDLRI